MNYEENNIDWKIGDIVIHDADRKAGHMLMSVVKIELQGITTEYIDKENKIGAKYYMNDKKFLHDPKRFGIDSSKFTKSSAEEPHNKDLTAEKIKNITMIIIIGIIFIVLILALFFVFILNKK